MAEKQSSKLTTDQLFARLLNYLAVKEDADGIDRLNDALDSLNNDLAHMKLLMKKVL